MFLHYKIQHRCSPISVRPLTLLLSNTSTTTDRPLTDYFTPLRLWPPFGEMFGESVAGPERAHRHPVPGQLVRRAGRRADDAPARGDRDERAHQNPSDGMHVAAVASASRALGVFCKLRRASGERPDDDHGQSGHNGGVCFGRRTKVY